MRPEKKYEENVIVCKLPEILAWTKVEPSTINKCFGHAGFKLPGNVEAEQQVFETPENFTNDEWNDFVDFDNQLEIAGELNDEEITQALKRRRIEEDDEDEDEKVITRTDLNKALDTVRSFLQTNCLETSRLDLENISRDVNSFYASSQSQASIKCFFSAL